jgi:hypothetical protein
METAVVCVVKLYSRVQIHRYSRRTCCHHSHGGKATRLQGITVFMMTPFQWSEKQVATKRRRRPQYEFTQPRPSQFRALSDPFESSWGFFLNRRWAVLCDNLPPCEPQILLTDHVVHRLTIDTGHWPAVRCLQEYQVSIPASDKQLIGLIGLQVASVPWMIYCMGFSRGRSEENHEKSQPLNPPAVSVNSVEKNPACEVYDRSDSQEILWPLCKTASQCSYGDSLVLISDKFT